MGKHGLLIVTAAIAGCSSGGMQAFAQSRPPQATNIDIGSTSLSSALAELAREQGVDILIDQALVAERRTARVRGRLTVEATLTALLSGTGIAFRRTSDGAYVLFAQRDAPPATDDDGAIAEILVVGRKTQNADIRRTENDIQPYRVFSRREVLEAHRDNVDDFLRSRETRNGQIGTANQDPFARSGSNQSEISLRGLGSAQTLVLVDGRRLPAIPTISDLLQQPDVNGIPLSAIERIEILPSTAGGIYGPAATGGVVNIVLQRDFRGAELNLVSGITQRGDAARLRLEGRIGFTPDGGRTDVMLLASHTISGPLLAGDRDYLAQSRRRALSNSPMAYLDRLPTGQGISVYSVGGPLTLDPALGGYALNSEVTFLPLNFAGSANDRTALLRANAGSIAETPANDTGGAYGDLLNRPTITTGMLNVRHRFGNAVEAFVDALYMRDIGRTVSRVRQPTAIIPADAPGNPFAQPVIVTYPQLAHLADSETDLTTLRVTGGVIVTLPSSWRATADYSFAQATSRFRVYSALPVFAYYGALASGSEGPDGLPALDPFGNGAAFAAAAPSYVQANRLSLRRANRSSEATMRLAGPLLRLPGGPLSLTILGSLRRDVVPVSAFDYDAGGGLRASSPSPRVEQRTRSAYAEIRAPMTSRDAGLPILKGLELQAAIRFDAQISSIEKQAFASLTTVTTRLERNAPLYTFGIRFFPARHLMVRASIATGLLPPPIDQISSNSGVIGGYDAFGIGDPKRGGRPIGTEGQFTYQTGGSPDLHAEKARSITVGFVLNPEGRGPRLSIDATQIDKRDEISAVYSANPAYFVANEARFPDRIIRAPLTDADAALGFTAGRILGIDTRSFNSGRTLVQAVDAQLDWQAPTSSVGDLGGYVRVTWQPILRRQKAPDLSAVNLAGYADGPLAWRGNGGLNWSKGGLTIGVNAQFLGSYRVANSAFNATAQNPTVVRYQGVSHIPAQAYLDLSATRRFALHGRAGPLRTIELSLGIENLLDHKVPVVANPDTGGFSPYGDPRGRRFDLRVTAGL